MAKISHENLIKEINAKGFILINDADYKNMQSPITIQCLKGHTIDTNLETFRKASFVCPICDGATDFHKPLNVPAKEGFRIVAFDQATEKMGISIYDGGKLVYCDLITFSGDVTTRLCKIRSFIEDTVIARWEPDFMVFEDIQYQQNIMTFKILAMLLGVCETCARKAGIDYEVVLPKVWRSGIGYSGKNRAEEKRLAIETVQKMFRINVSEDVAEAILIGKYATRQHKSTKAF